MIRKENGVGKLLAHPPNTPDGLLVRKQYHIVFGGRSRSGGRPPKTNILHTEPQDSAKRLGSRYLSSFKSDDLERRQNANMSFKAWTGCCVMSYTARSCSTARQYSTDNCENGTGRTPRSIINKSRTYCRLRIDETQCQHCSD